MSEPHTVGCAICRDREACNLACWRYCPECGSRIRPHPLTPKGDAYRDRLIRERLNVRKERTD